MRYKRKLAVTVGFVSGSICIHPFLFRVETTHRREHQALLLVALAELSETVMYKTSFNNWNPALLQCKLSRGLESYSLRNSSVDQVLQPNSC